MPLVNESGEEEKINLFYTGDAVAKICSYVVQEGDSLWTIAKKVYGDATAYPLIISENQQKYPQIEQGKLSIGQGLSFNCASSFEQQDFKTSKDVSHDNKGQNSQENFQKKKSFKWWNPFTWFIKEK